MRDNKLLVGTLFFVFGIFAIGCNDRLSDDENEITDTLYKWHKPSHTGIDISTKIKESLKYNAVFNDALYFGSGIGIIDINGDDLPDVFIAGNTVPDQLYLNKGDFKFENITKSSGIVDNDGWSTGVSIVDIDGDGDQDIYVNKFLLSEKEKLKNRLYINDGNGSFSEMASEFGIDDDGYSIMSCFFDYDNDGDLDLYIVNQPPNSLEVKQYLAGKADFQFTNKMFRNDGDSFKDVTEQAGLKNYNWSLSALVFDYNNDGYIDIYVANDYEQPDEFFINQGNGTFINQADSLFKHMSMFSMGTDFGDINNDGLLDILTTDMVAEDNYRQKTNMAGMNPEKFWLLANNGYHYQYMYNCLHLNNGLGAFSDIAQLAGVQTTDWSWASLFIDQDLDGYKDIFIANGIFKEVRNKDYEVWKKEQMDSLAKAPNYQGVTLDFLLYLSSKATQQKVANVAYKNNGDLSFSKMNKEWGLERPTITQGAAYADFDNDGDMDIIMSHTAEGIDIMESRAAQQTNANYLKIKLKGYAGNTAGLNTKVKIRYDNDKIQIQESTPYRGFMSTNEDVIHFGLGASSVVNSVEIQFLNGKNIVLSDISANQTLVISENDASKSIEVDGDVDAPIFIEENLPLVFGHKENQYDDFAKEVLLPYKLSSLGPASCVGDVNGDGKEDMFIGGSAGNEAKIIFSINDEPVHKTNQYALTKDRLYEDASALFFDADGDGDLDLFVTSGSNEFPIGSELYQDRLYFNNGAGDFKRGAFPKNITSNHCAITHDIDGDNDLDLIVAGRQVPGNYGKNADAYVYINNGQGVFLDKTQDLAGHFTGIGMVTDMVIADLNNDNTKELVICGEWMPLSVHDISDQGVITKLEIQSLEKTHGLWNTLELADFDNDGNIDIAAGNIGNNTKFRATESEPLKIYVDDFDNNGTNDVYLGSYDNNGICYPVRGRQCSSEQMPFVQKKFGSYESFATASIEQVLDGKINNNSIKKEAYELGHVLFFNNGDFGFDSKLLPNSAQRSPINDFTLVNLDQDHALELYGVGNFYDREVETTRSDAGVGFAMNIKTGRLFEEIPTLKLGATANNDARRVFTLSSNDTGNLFIVNNHSIVQKFNIMK